MSDLGPGCAKTSKHFQRNGTSLHERCIKSNILIACRARISNSPTVPPYCPNDSSWWGLLHNPGHQRPYPSRLYQNPLSRGLQMPGINIVSAAD